MRKKKETIFVVSSGVFSKTKGLFASSRFSFDGLHVWFTVPYDKNEVKRILEENHIEFTF